MAVVPLFVVDMATLKTRLRLDGAKQAGALAKIDQAVEDVRFGFYSRLGAARITALKATAYTDQPTTDAQLLRALANSVEIRWVDLLLMRRLPALFVDSAGSRQQAWNDEGAFVARRRTEQESAALEAEIQEDLEKLAGDASVDEETINVSTIGPAETPDLPGASIWPSRRSENL